MVAGERAISLDFLPRLLEAIASLASVLWLLDASRVTRSLSPQLCWGD